MKIKIKKGKFQLEIEDIPVAITWTFFVGLAAFCLCLWIGLI
jgi:hypothetical protein